MRRPAPIIAASLIVGLALALGGCHSPTADGASHDAFGEASYGLMAKEAPRRRISNDAGAPQPEAIEATRKVIRSANLALTVEDIDATGARIETLANESGGFVLSASRGNYHIKVPASGLDAALAALEGLGTVTNRSLSGNDVTAEYVDLEVRIKNAHAARESYEALLRKAATVEEMLKIEQALHEVQERIELIEGRRKFLDEHLALSDIHINLREERTRGPLQVIWDVVVWPIKKLWWL
jgi:hypothetical protein